MGTMTLDLVPVDVIRCDACGAVAHALIWAFDGTYLSPRCVAHTGLPERLECLQHDYGHCPYKEGVRT